MRRIRAAKTPPVETWAADTYEGLYEAHAVALPPALSTGAGDYDTMGRIMLSALLQEGLQPAHTFVDFGCGTGRLARHVIPRLPGGVYIGVDISPSMLAQARLQYLRDAHRITRGGGRFMLSCLTMDLPAAHGVFLESTSRSLAERWTQVRNVTTSYELMTSIAELAGWSVVRWYKGDEELIDLDASPGHRCALGQSICVLQRH
jgi:SAM-dependent methyltransferase